METALWLGGVEPTKYRENQTNEKKHIFLGPGLVGEAKTKKARRTKNNKNTICFGVLGWWARRNQKKLTEKTTNNKNTCFFWGPGLVGDAKTKNNTRKPKQLQKLPFWGSRSGGLSGRAGESVGALFCFFVFVFVIEVIFESV